MSMPRRVIMVFSTFMCTSSCSWPSAHVPTSNSPSSFSSSWAILPAALAGMMPWRPSMVACAMLPHMSSRARCVSMVTDSVHLRMRTSASRVKRAPHSLVDFPVAGAACSAMFRHCGQRVTRASSRRARSVGSLAAAPGSKHAHLPSGAARTARHAAQQEIKAPGSRFARDAGCPNSAAVRP